MTVSLSHTLAPVVASSAISRPSNAPTNPLPFHSATPRLTTSQHPFSPKLRGTLGSKLHSRLPVRTSIAWTTLHDAVTYMMPSTTSGVDSTPRVDSRLYVHTRPRFLALAAVISVSLLNRVS